MSGQSAKRWYFAKRPTGLIEADTFVLKEELLPSLSPGEFLFKTIYVSLDATNRVWLSDWDLYMEPVHLGEPMRGFVFGEVIESRNSDFPVGCHASGLHSWSDFIVTNGEGFAAFPTLEGVDLAEAFAILSVAGPTAHVGLHHIGGLRSEDTVVVSGAAGAVGIMVGQIARIAGARVIGIAGTPEKCRMLTTDYGFDAAIDYKRESVVDRLATLCPNGIDLCFENVGGEILDASLTHMKNFGRVVICGLISSYNESGRVPGPFMFRNLIMRRLTVRGFVILDHADLFPTVMHDLIQWMREGRLRMPIHIVEGLTNVPGALNLLSTGSNIGKVLARL